MKNLLPLWTTLRRGLKLFCLALILFTGVTSIAQTGRASRPDLNSLSNTDLKTLHDAIIAWITQDLVDMHGSNFATIHRTNGFFPWHREHIAHLEEYLTEQGLTQFVPLPAWNPANSVPAYFNGFDAGGSNYNNIFPCTSCPNPPRETYSTFFTGALPAAFVVHSPNPTGVNNDLCDFTNVAFLSDALEGEVSVVNSVAAFRIPFYLGGSGGFHNITHANFGNGTAMSGTAIAAAAAIFWPWHAFVDEVWYNWDCNCKPKNNGTTITDAYDENTDVIITTSVIWDGAITPIKKISGRIIIEPGGELALDNDIIVEMIGDNFTCGNTGIEIKAAGPSDPKGGALFIDNGSIIRGITTLGSNGVDGSPNQVQYNNVWAGIKVYGDPNSPAFSFKHGAVGIVGYGKKTTGIQNAEIGIESINGGIIGIREATFLNCNIGVKIGPYNSLYRRTFEDCDFIWQDQSTYKFFAHEVHPYHGQAHVVLESLKGIDFAGCKFENQEDFIFSGGPHNDNRGVGILATNSTFAVHKNGSATQTADCIDWSGSIKTEFEGLSFGIQGGGTSGSHVATIGVQEAVFTDNHVAIEVEESFSLHVSDLSTFSYSTSTAHFNATDHHHFIETANTDIVFIYESTFTSNDPEANFISVTNAPSYGGTRIAKNTLTNTHASPTGSVGISTTGTHNKTDILCNDFSGGGFNFCIRNFGNLKNQGGSGIGAGNKFPAYVSGLGAEQRLRNEPGASAYNYIYRSPAGTYPGEDPETYRTSNITKTPTANPELKCTFNCAGNFVGIHNMDKLKGDVTVYPNPSYTGSIYIDFLSNFDKPYTVTITDITGRVVYEGNLTGPQNIVDVSNASNGVYLVLIKQDNLLVNTQKLVLNK